MALSVMAAPAADAAETAAACTWRKTAWELPAGTDSGEINGYDGSRYAVGVTGRYGWQGISDPNGTFWDNGKVVFRLGATVPHLNDVNASGLIVGDEYVDNEFYPVTVGRDGRTTRLPVSPAWEGVSARLVNNRGDIVGVASIGVEKYQLVLWPASAPGTYRELPTPNVFSFYPAGLDEQGRIIAQTSGGGFVWDTNGQYRALATQGSGARSTPRAIRAGHIVGSMDTTSTYAAAEFNAQGGLVRVLRNGAITMNAIGGNGTVGGSAFVDSTRRTVLWRDGVIVDTLAGLPWSFELHAISDDERAVIGTELDAPIPVQYNCS